MDYTRDARLAARYWARAVRAGREFAQETAGAAHYREIRYEELVTRLESYLRALGGESSAEQVTRAIHGDSMGRWQRELTKDERAAVKDEIGALLIELGYCTDLDW